MDLDALDHERHTERALELAREAAARGDEPFGSVLVRDDAVVMEARNAVNTAADLRRHPELTLAKRAGAELSPEERRETVMYTSTEPCPMCAGGIDIAGLRAVGYSVSTKRLAEVRGRDPGVTSADVFEHGSGDVERFGPILPEAGVRVHRDCW